MRRLRDTPAVRAMVREVRVGVEHLIQPVFVVEGDGQPETIHSLPGQFRWSLGGLDALVERVRAAGVPGIALFPKVDAAVKSPAGDEALNPDGLVPKAIRRWKDLAPEVLVIADIALDPYTTHGHDGILTSDGSTVDNDSTVARLAEMAVVCATAGADWVAPSDMMDGRVSAIRQRLDQAGFSQVSVLSYAAKFNSAFYGPFREAVGSAQAAGTMALDKSTYQLDPANRRQAVADALLDDEEGADWLMVKPAGPYLDILRELRQTTRLPLAAYQVSGEYAQICAAAERGWLDRRRIRDESLLSIRRAGADLILSYFALEIAEEAAKRAPLNLQ